MGADADLQRLRRLRRQLVFRPQVREVVYVNAQRILAVLAAVLFVGAVGLATVGPQMVSLGAVLSYFSPTAETGLHSWLVRVIGSWSWVYVAHPLLIRPAWLPLGSR